MFMQHPRFPRIPDGMFSSDLVRDAAALVRMLRGEPAGPSSSELEKQVREMARLVREASPPASDPADVYARRKARNELPATRSGDCGDACRATLDGAEPCLETCARLDPVADPVAFYAARNRIQATRRDGAQRADPVQPRSIPPRRPRTLADFATTYWKERPAT